MSRTSTVLGSLLLLSVPLAGQTVSRASVGPGGVQGNEDSWGIAISANGRYVVFYSDSNNLVLGDRNAEGDVFLRDRVTGKTALVSRDSAGLPGNGESDYPSLSADGRFVVFRSQASNLVAGDTAGQTDVFLRDLSTGATERVSVSTAGEQGNAGSHASDVSADGRFVVFSSYASNLVAGDTNQTNDIFVRDRLAGTTIRVSVDSAGVQSPNGAFYPYISDDGSAVVFDSSSPLVADDTNNLVDIYVHELATGVTSRANVASNGAQANSSAAYATISADGRYVVFGSMASNLAPADTNAAIDLFVRDRLTGTTQMVDLSSSGEQANNYTSRGTISADGRYIAFKSTADNLVPDDTNGTMDVFVRDLELGLTRRVSVSSAGLQADGFSSEPTISADGRHVAFYSEAENLVPNDTNWRWDVFVASQSPRLALR